MLNLTLSRIHSEYPGQYSTNQNAPFKSINSSLIGENIGSGPRKSFSIQPQLVIEQQSTVTCSHSLTSKLIKVIMPVVRKDVKLFMEELKERSSMVMHFH